MESNEAERPGPAEAPADRHPGAFRGFGRVSLLTFASRVLGLVRDAMMASRFGNGALLDAFSVAFRIPNLARRLFGEGALTAAFLPALVSELESAGRESAWRLATSVFFALAVALSAVVLVGEVLLLGGGALLPEDHSARALTDLTAVMFPYLLLICLAAQISAVFHALGRFGWPAFSPIVLNAIWIGVLILPAFDDWTPQRQIFAVAWTVLAAGLVQLLWPLWVLTQHGFRFVWDWQRDRDTVRALTWSMLPIVVGLSVTQLNTLIDSLIAWGFSADEGVAVTAARPLESGTASALYLGQRMYQFPLGVFGVALGTVLFPLFTRHAEARRDDLLLRDFISGMKLVTIVGLPAGVGLAIVSLPLSEALFQRGAFDEFDARQTAEMITAYGLGVWAFCTLLIVNRLFFARRDSRTPMRIGLMTMGLNLLFNLALIWPLGGFGLALATSLACYAQVLISLYHLRHSLAGWRLSLMTGTVLRSIVATMLMAAACYAALALLEGRAGRTVRVTAAVFAGAGVYLAAAAVLGLREVFDLLRLRRRE